MGAIKKQKGRHFTHKTAAYDRKYPVKNSQDDMEFLEMTKAELMDEVYPLALSRPVIQITSCY